MSGKEGDEVLSPRRNSGRRSAVGSRKEEKLVQVAAEMFHERGYDATSLQDIAEELGLLKGSLYHYIGSKDDLLWAIIRKQQSSAMALVQRCAALDCGADDRLSEFVLGYAESLRRDRAVLGLSARFQPAQRPAPRDCAGRWRQVRSICRRSTTRRHAGRAIPRRH